VHTGRQVAVGVEARAAGACGGERRPRFRRVAGGLGVLGPRRLVAEYLFGFVPPSYRSASLLGFWVFVIRPESTRRTMPFIRINFGF
jgi:hypothetical protein